VVGTCYLGGKTLVEPKKKRIGFDDYIKSKISILISKHIARQMISSKYGKIIHYLLRMDYNLKAMILLIPHLNQDG
jgi:hypothetical protein